MEAVPAPDPAKRDAATFFRPAGGAFAAAALAWAWHITGLYREGESTSVLGNACFVALTLAAGAAMLMARRRLAGICLVQAYMVVIYSAVTALQTQIRPLWFAAGGGFAAAVLITMAPGEKQKVETAFSPWGWMRENLEAVVVAFIMALVIRCFCIEVFKIPSSSMEPTLLGDVPTRYHNWENCDFRNYHPGRTSGGDRIMVTKFYYAFTPVERFDVLVFKFPLNQSRNFIKRVVGLPEEKLVISGGNLYTCPKGESRFRIARKPLRTQDSLWISEQVNFLEDRKVFDENWTAEPAGGTARGGYQIGGGELCTLEASGERGVRFHTRLTRSPDPGASGVGDLHVAFDFEAAGTEGEAFAEVVNEWGRFEARLSGSGTSELRFHAPGSERLQPTRLEPLDGARLAPDRRTRLALSVFDGAAYARVDGRIVARIPFIEFKDELKVNVNPDRSVSFGARGVTIKVRKLTVGRDIFYRGRRDRSTLGLEEGEAVEIPARSYMMMGDNTENSHDSRAWIRYSYKIRGRAEPVECEGQETSQNDGDILREVREKFNLAREPYIAIRADKNGDAHHFAEDELLEQVKPEAFRFVDERFIVGKAFWTWFPLPRAFRIIR